MERHALAALSDMRTIIEETHSDLGEGVEADAFTPLREDETVDMCHSHVMCPQRFLAGALHKEFTDASRDYLLAFPRAKFPDRVSPWWVMTGDVIRKRIATGKPYTKADEPVFDKHGKILVEGTDGDIC